MRYNPLLLLVFFTGALLAGCRDGEPGGGASASVALAGTVHRDDQLILGLLYQQRAAEYRALCLQCYNLAWLRVAEFVRDRKNYTQKPFAIVTDLDETALDNSGNEAWLYNQDSAFFPAEFDHWSVAGDPWAVPGAVEFFRYVDGLHDLKGRKLHIYYVSNRTDDTAILEHTRARMKALGFPQTGDTLNFRFQAKGTPSSKEPRRLVIAARDTIMLLLGDNLVDLSKVFDGTAADSATRRRRVDSMGASWGKAYIVFPNAEYGDWERALYPDGKYDSLWKEQGYRRKDLKPSAWQ